jgi:hypothetical protein
LGLADGTSQPEPNDRKISEEQPDDTKAQAKEAARVTHDHAYAQKTEFVDKMKRKLIDR